MRKISFASLKTIKSMNSREISMQQKQHVTFLQHCVSPKFTYHKFAIAYQNRLREFMELDEHSYSLRSFFAHQYQIRLNISLCWVAFCISQQQTNAVGSRSNLSTHMAGVSMAEWSTALILYQTSSTSFCGGVFALAWFLFTALSSGCGFHSDCDVTVALRYVGTGRSCNARRFAASKNGGSFFISHFPL